MRDIDIPDYEYIEEETDMEDDSESAYNHQLIVPIIAEGDAMGAIIFLSKDQKMGEVEGKLAQTAAGFLGKQMEQ